MQITNLPATNSFSATDVLAMEINGVTYKVTGAQLASAVKSIGSMVNGVKGDEESNYRTGNVNLTPANVGAKEVQSAVSNPNASGTAIAFIDSITQNAQGVITPTKKTVRSASTTESGLMSAEDKVKVDSIATLFSETTLDIDTSYASGTLIKHFNIGTNGSKRPIAALLYLSAPGTWVVSTPKYGSSSDRWDVTIYRGSSSTSTQTLTGTLHIIWI